MERLRRPVWFEPGALIVAPLSPVGVASPFAWLWFTLGELCDEQLPLARPLCALGLPIQFEGANVAMLARPPTHAVGAQCATLAC